MTREWGRSAVRQPRVHGRRPKRPWVRFFGMGAVVLVAFLLGRTWQQGGEQRADVTDASVANLDVGGGANYQVDVNQILPGSVLSVPLHEAIVLDQPEAADAELAQDTTAIVVESSAHSTTLVPTGGARGSGTASSAFTEDGFQHVVVATLPDPPVGYAYEGWLIRSTPFDYFSTGSLIQHADDLKWYLLWSAPEDHSDYTKVIVTIEPTDGDPAPSTHVLEGEF